MNYQWTKYSMIFLLIFFLSVSCKEDPVSDNTDFQSNSIEQEVHRLVNLHRDSIGLETLEWNDVIAEQCRNHSIDMANAHTINHDGFNDRINKIGETIPWSWAGENVAYDYGAQFVVESWLSSPGHKENIESNSNLTGVGVAFDEDSVTYFTQIFIRSN